VTNAETEAEAETETDGARVASAPDVA